MQDKHLEINRLKARREHLFGQLKRDFDRHYEGAMHLDIMSTLNLYCKHRCGVYSEFSARAYAIEDIDNAIAEKEGVIFWPKWRAARLIMNNLLRSDQLRNDEQLEKAAKFMTEIEDILSEDDANEPLLANDEREHDERLVYLAELLHPWIMKHAFDQYRNGQLRDAVLNAFIALGDLIRMRTGLPNDGAALVSQALSLKNPKLILSEIETESGISDQTGFMQILQGSFIGIRNPKAHSIHHDLTTHTAAQYLILASLLARRVSEASDAPETSTA